MNTWTSVTIPATPDYAREPEGIPFVLTQAERSKAAQYRAHLERQRRERNAADARRATCPKSLTN